MKEIYICIFSSIHNKDTKYPPQSHPYPCIGLFKFLNFSIHLSPIYPEILNRIRAGQTLLDLGCCLGQDLRKLAFDAGTSSNLIGADIEASFLQLGYELFQDRASLQAHFVTGSIFDEDFLATRKGSIDIIYLGSFLHLFNLAKQRVIVSRLEELLVPRAGSVVFGRHIAALEGGPFFMESLGWDMFRHSEVTIRELWGAGWEVHSQLEEYESATQESGNWQGDTTKQMTFWAIRR